MARWGYNATGMNVTVKQLVSLRIAMIRHKGPYDQLGNEFERLWAWVNTHNVPAQRTIGIYFDNPDFVAASQLRSAACVEIPLGFRMTDKGGLPIEEGQINGGSYATMTYVGPYDELAKVWTDFTHHVEKVLKREISENPAFEVYVNDASDTAPQHLITELYMPLV